MIKPISASNEICFGKVYQVAPQYRPTKAMRRIGASLEAGLYSNLYANKDGKTLVQQLEEKGYDAIILYDKPNSVKLKVTNDLSYDSETNNLQWNSSKTIEKFSANNYNHNNTSSFLNVKSAIQDFLKQERITSYAGKLLNAFFLTSALLAAGCLMKTCMSNSKQEAAIIKKPLIEIVQKATIK